MKIAILGGSFDPPHLGHLILADSVLSELCYDNVLFIPDRIPPHKRISGEVSDIDRLNMIKLSIENDDRFILEDYEIKNDEVSYTINTIGYILKNYKNIDGNPGLIIGSDLIRDFDKWKESFNISTLADIVAVNRGDDGNMYKDNIDRYNMKILYIPRIDISSTIIRDRIKRNMSVRYLVKDSVYEYITSNNLYKTL